MHACPIHRSEPGGGHKLSLWAWTLATWHPKFVVPGNPPRGFFCLVAPPTVIWNAVVDLSFPWSLVVVSCFPYNSRRSFLYVERQPSDQQSVGISSLNLMQCNCWWYWLLITVCRENQIRTVRSKRIRSGPFDQKR